MLFWIKTEDKLPEEGKHVLGRYGGDRMGSSEEVRYSVVRLYKGLSAEDREKLPKESYRKGLFQVGDEEGNNKKPYAWFVTGGIVFDGQEISHWAEFNHIKED